MKQISPVWRHDPAGCVVESVAELTYFVNVARVTLLESRYMKIARVQLYKWQWGRDRDGWLVQSWFGLAFVY